MSRLASPGSNGGRFAVRPGAGLKERARALLRLGARKSMGDQVFCAAGAEAFRVGRSYQGREARLVRPRISSSEGGAGAWMRAARLRRGGWRIAAERAMPVESHAPVGWG